MLKTDRFQAIMSLLEVNGTVRVSDIMEKFSVSDMTVRRDLDEMEKQGLLERVHGGAKLKDFIGMWSFLIEKNRLCCKKKSSGLWKRRMK